MGGPIAAIEAGYTDPVVRGINELAVANINAYVGHAWRIRREEDQITGL